MRTKGRVSAFQIDLVDSKEWPPEVIDHAEPVAAVVVKERKGEKEDSYSVAEIVEGSAGG